MSPPRILVRALGGVRIARNRRDPFCEVFRGDATRSRGVLDRIPPSERNADRDAGKRIAAAVAGPVMRQPVGEATIGASCDRWSEMLSRPGPRTVALFHVLAWSGVSPVALGNWAARNLARTRSLLASALLDRRRRLPLSGHLGIARIDSAFFPPLRVELGVPAGHCLAIGAAAAHVGMTERFGSRIRVSRSPEVGAAEPRRGQLLP